MFRTIIIAAPTKLPRFLDRTDFASTIAPATRAVAQCQQNLNVLLFSVVLHVYWLINCSSRVALDITVRGLAVSKSSLVLMAAVLARGVWLAWDSKAMRKLKRKLEFEFFTLMLTTGHHICVVLLWPGWWLFAICASMIWLYLG